MQQPHINGEERPNKSPPKNFSSSKSQYYKMKIPNRNFDNQRSAESLDKVSERNFESFASNNEILEVDSEDSAD